MKTFLPEMALGIASLSLVLCMGCQGQKANAEEVSVVPNTAPVIVVAAAENKPVVAATPSSAIPAVIPPGSIIITNEPAKSTEAPSVITPAADASVATAGTNVVPEVIPPSELELSPALTEVIKLVQAGVGEDVLAAYITNSTEIFDIGSNEILYLHDLGVPGNIITSLIHHDSTPESLARRHAMNSVKPLPPGVSLTTPATNVYPPAVAQQPPVEPATETASITTEVPAATGAATPAVVYTVPPVQEPVTVNHFYTELAPYGTWIDVAGYGRCWRPTVAVWNSSWRPYADGGRWVWTDRGWYWYSDYSWGWAPFHYGRWTTHHGVGWVWVPDVHWGPAWVSWRNTSSYCGWAPLPPSARWVSGRGFYHNSLSVGVSFDFGLSDHHYVFLPTSRFCDRRPSTYYVGHHHARSLHRESVVVNNYQVRNNTIVNNGVGFDRVSRATRGTIRQASIRPATESPRGTLRREILDNDGRTLTVARPTASSRGAATINSPTRPVSAFSNARSQNGRIPSSSVSTATTANNTRDPASIPQVDSSRSPRSIIMRGNGRAGGEPRTANDNPGTSRNPTVSTPGTITRRPSAPETPIVRTPEEPRGGRTAPRPTQRPATSVAVARPATVPAPVVRESTPAPTVRVPAPAARPQPTRNFGQPDTRRSPVTTVPSVSPTPRQAPSAPSYSRSPRPAPSAPTYNPSPRPSPSPRISSPAPSPSPRVSSPAPAPAPAARPAPSRPSRASSDDGRRNSR